MGQTTLSSIVKSIEEKLGFPVFQRAPSGVVATDKGEQLLALVWEIEIKYEELLNLKNRQLNVALPIVVPLAPSINIGASLPLMERFYSWDSHSALIFEDCPRLDTYNQLIQNKANIGITYLKPEELEWLSYVAEKNKIIINPLLDDRFYLAVSKSHPLAGCGQISLKKLYDETFAMATTFRVATESTPILSSLSRNCSRIISLPTIHMVKNAVLEQNMAAILTGYAIRYDICYSPAAFGIAELRDLDSANELKLCVLHRHNKSLRYPERVLLQCIEDYFSAISPTGAAAIRESLPC
jgi:DNA-binding transcriptional LysR family regulator